MSAKLPQSIAEWNAAGAAYLPGYLGSHLKTIEPLGSTREGAVQCIARPLHQGRTTQVWDATVSVAGDAKPIAGFRSTQLILWPKP